LQLPGVIGITVTAQQCKSRASSRSSQFEVGQQVGQAVANNVQIAGEQVRQLNCLLLLCVSDVCCICPANREQLLEWCMLLPPSMLLLTEGCVVLQLFLQDSAWGWCPQFVTCSIRAQALRTLCTMGSMLKLCSHAVVPERWGRSWLLLQQQLLWRCRNSSC
jgi:hypothetical protein